MRTVLGLLARAGRERDPERWTVRCRTIDDRRAKLEITLHSTGVRVTASAPGPWTLTPLELGRLRGALAEAVIAYGRSCPVDVPAQRTAPERRAGVA